MNSALGSTLGYTDTLGSDAEVTDTLSLGEFSRKQKQREVHTREETFSAPSKNNGKCIQERRHSVHLSAYMRNARLDEAQAGIKIARRNINKLQICR